MDEQTGGAAQRRRTRVEMEQIAAEFTSSGLKRAEFCRRHGMSLGTLTRYLKQQHQEADSGVANDGLVRVELVGTKLASDRDSGCRLAVTLAHGRKVEVRAGFDPSTLEGVIRVLENM